MDQWEAQAFNAKVNARESDARARMIEESPTEEATRIEVQEIRLELAFVASLVSSLNRQLQAITRLLIAIIVLLAIIAIRA